MKPTPLEMIFNLSLAALLCAQCILVGRFLYLVYQYWLNKRKLKKHKERVKQIAHAMASTVWMNHFLMKIPVIAGADYNHANFRELNLKQESAINYWMN